MAAWRRRFGVNEQAHPRAPATSQLDLRLVQIKSMFVQSSTFWVFWTCHAVVVTDLLVSGNSFSYRWLDQVVDSTTLYVIPSSFHTFTSQPKKYSAHTNTEVRSQAASAKSSDWLHSWDSVFDLFCLKSLI